MTKDEALKQGIEALENIDRWLPTIGQKGLRDYEADALAAMKEALAQPAQPAQEPVAAAKKDEVFAASIEFIGTLTGMTPPPIETAPPEVFKPFWDFTEKVCEIFATPPASPPAQELVAIPDCGEAGHDDGCCGNAQCLPSFRAVKTYHEGKPVYLSQTEFPPECKTVAEQTAYAFGWWKALESVRTEQPAQEPVAVVTDNYSRDGVNDEISAYLPVGTELYTIPQQRSWVGLTDEDIKIEINESGLESHEYGQDTIQLIYAIEAKLKEKNA